MIIKTQHPVAGLAKNPKSSSQREIPTPVAPVATQSLVMITTYPPKECGLATFASDLVQAIQNQFSSSYTLHICALNPPINAPTEHLFHVLETEQPNAFQNLAKKIKKMDANEWVIIQHEFGLYRNNEAAFLEFLNTVEKKIMVVLHTVLPQPSSEIEGFMKILAFLSHTLVVMTHHSKAILIERYGIESSKIIVIPHGTHLIEHQSKTALKTAFKCENRIVLSTFGLLSSGKSIETTLRALPKVIARFPEVLFLIIGKTHPGVVQAEGERYRESLDDLIHTLKLENHTVQLNAFIPLPKLLDLLQLTDIYLFTSKNQDQAVSGTFAYAMSCGCPIVATPIPHAQEVVQNGSGILFDFEQSDQLADQLLHLLEHPELQMEMRLNGLHYMEPTAWENTAIRYINHLQNHSVQPTTLKYKWPKLNTKHVKKMTTDFGMLQFSKLNLPDTLSGYTLDDNARALVAFCQQYTLTAEPDLLIYIERYLKFIRFCLQPNGQFLNYVQFDQTFSSQNGTSNLEDCFGRALWAIGFLKASASALPSHFLIQAELMLEATQTQRSKLESPRAIAFTIKGLYYAHEANTLESSKEIEALANQLLERYYQSATKDWEWFESYLTYGNSILPEALLLAWRVTQRAEFKIVAISSLKFLLSQTFSNNQIKVISNKGWLHSGQSLETMNKGGEQPIDVAYTIMTLFTFYNELEKPDYAQKMMHAYHWFLGENNRNEIIYNPKTGGCYDGLEHDHINLNQGAESTLSHLLARQTMERYAQQKMFN